MSETLDANKLKNITVTGKGLVSNLVEVCSGAKLTSSFSSVTEMTLTFNDNPDLSIFRSGILSRGASITYGQWRLVTSDISVSAGDIGPQLEVVAPSRTVSSLRAQTGAKTWGTVDAASWVKQQLAGIGSPALVQPGLGTSILIRNAPTPDQAPDTTWDVLTDLAREKGVWLFERGPTLVFARPTWLMSTTLFRRRSWSFWWDNWKSYSEGLAGMPEYSNEGSSTPPESLKLRLISDDADTIKPGDEVVLTGAGVGPMGGKWIVEDVSLPFAVDAPVTASCSRPVDPKQEAPRNSPEKKADPVAGRTPTASPSGGSPATGGSTRSDPALISLVNRFVSKYRGTYVDFDGAFGAQCVDLVAQYNYEVVGGANIRGNGNQWFNNPAAAGAYTRIGATENPQVGDIACWDAFYGGGYGHVCVVVSEDWGVSSLQVFTQNPGPANITSLSKQGLQGFLRPNRHR